MLPVINRKRLLCPISFPLASMMASVLGFLPNAPLTSDQVTLLRRDNVVSGRAASEGRTLKALGIIPETLAAILPSYLWRYRATGQFSRTFAA
jgi:hypothetical protein